MKDSIPEIRCLKKENETMNEQELLKSVNPSYTTGKGCLAMLLGTGDPDAAELCKTIDLSELQRNDSTQEDPMQKDIVRSYIVGQDARYSVWNQIAEDSACDIIVDLPCGYLPHGLAVARMGKTYYGLDLPMVINEIAPAIAGICEKEPGIQKEKIHFCAADATNYASMKKALEGANGRICIITDGMLALFNRNELDEVCRAVRKLLTDFGGEWYTSDAMSVELMALSFEGVMQKDPQIVRNAVVAGSAAQSDIDNTENPFISWTPERLKQYMEEAGFRVEEFPFSEKLPALRSVDAQTLERLTASYKKMIEWRLIPNKESEAPDLNLPFAVESTVEDGVFTASIQGRMDTITAPELLKQYQEAGQDIQAVHVDVSRMAYVSSAGLRVLLMMYKSLGNKDNFELTGVSEAVREILETTGFDQFLLK